MIPIFAQELSPPPAGLLDWLECAVWIIGAAALISWLVQMWLPKPSIEKQIRKLREEVQAAFVEKDKHLHSTFATKADLIERFDVREESAIEFRDEIKLQMRELDKKLSERSTAIFDGIRSLGREISHLEGRLEK